jgi:hypothetical protein
VRGLEPPAPWHERASLESHGAGGWACASSRELAQPPRARPTACTAVGRFTRFASFASLLNSVLSALANRLVYVGI